MSNKVPDYVYLRNLSHSNSAKEIIARTKDDNEENEYTDEIFLNRKGTHPVDSNNDIFPSMVDKKEPKKEKGLRKFKGAETIRKPKEGNE